MFSAAGTFGSSVPAPTSLSGIPDTEQCTAGAARPAPRCGIGACSITSETAVTVGAGPAHHRRRRRRRPPRRPRRTRPRRRSTAVEASRAIIDALADDTEPHYGISTGFGALATTFIPADRRAQLQASLVRSHAAGSGPEVEREVVRALMLLRLSTLMTGRTGAQPHHGRDLRRAAQRRHHPGRARVRLARLLRRPRAARPLRARGDGRRPGAGRRRAASTRPTRSRPPGIRPVVLAEKEGLALINGTDGMLGMLSLATPRPRRPADARPTSPPR